MRPRQLLRLMRAGIMALLIPIGAGSGVLLAQSDPSAPDSPDQEEEGLEEEASEEEAEEFAALAALAHEGRDDEVRRQALAILAEIEADEEAGPPEIAGYFALLEEAIGAKHPVFGFVLNNYGRRRLRAYDFTEAWRALDRSLAVHRELLPPGDLELALILKDLARALDGLGLPGRALRARRHRLAILKRAVDPKDPNDAELRGELASTYLLAGAPDTALSHALRAERLARHHFDRTASEAPEDRAIAYEAVRRRSIGVALSVLASQAEPDSSPGEEVDPSPEEGEETAGLDESYDEPDPQLGDQQTAEREEKETAKPGDQEETAQTVRTDVIRHVWDEVIRSRTVALDRLAGSGAASGTRDRGAAIGLPQVAAALPADGALIAFVRYDRVSNHPPEEGTPPGPRPSYIVLALQAGSTAPEAVPLGEAAGIDPLIARVRELAVMIPGERPGVDGVAGQTYVEAATDLRKAIWDPVAPLLAGAHRLFIVPDGAISLVSFAALPIEPERYLVETGPLLHYLSAERDLVRASRRAGGARGLLAIGGPDFDAAIETAGSGKGPQASCANLRSMTFTPVPGSLDEARAIADLFEKAPRENASGRRDDPSIMVLTGKRATEEALRTLAPDHAVLHLATRSFFAPESCRSILDVVPAGLDPVDAGPADGESEPAGDDTGPAEGEQAIEEGTGVADTPLVLSGLALAGANLVSKGETPGGDGILTAREIASLDLSHVDWAVLPATGSGLNGASSGARVHGLRRAFERAGAGTLIMSLWPIGDEASLEWLLRLYEGRLSGLETAEAMRAASVGLLEARRESGRSLMPIDWGAYVAAGDWR